MLSREELSAFGCTDTARAEQALRAIAARHGDAFADAAWNAAKTSAEPTLALGVLARLAEHLTPPSLAWVAPLAGASDFLPRLVFTRPGLIKTIDGSKWLKRSKPPERVQAEAVGATRHAADLLSLKERLRRHKYRELLRISVRDVVHGASSRELGLELSVLAQALVHASFQWLTRQWPSGRRELAVIALGKLGGSDLNFSSDIDLLYLFREEREGADAEHYTRLTTALTQSLAERTDSGFCFRVDLNLRPLGRGGPQVLSLAQALKYYDTQGRTWERSALLKARFIAGDEALGNEFLEAIAPFVWKRQTSRHASTVVASLQEMKGQIDLRGKASTQDVKLGPGGIREIEFFTNALQLLEGGKNPLVRERVTLKALRRLEQAGQLPAPDAEALEEAYLFLRRVENRLQMLEERQTQDLPADEPALHRLARGLGFGESAAFLTELERHRAFVRQAFKELLGQLTTEQLPDEPLLALALDLDAPLTARVNALADRGFHAPDAALRAIERISKVSPAPFVLGPSGMALEALRWLAELLRTPDPDQALMHLADFLAELPEPAGYVALLERHPLARRRLLNVFGQSDFLARTLIRHPGLLDALVQPESQSALKPFETIRQELAQRVTRDAHAEERLTSLRRYKNEEVLRIGLFDIADELSVPQVAEQLTSLADSVLDEVLFLAESEVRERYGSPRHGRAVEGLLVIGMGKLGGHELGYHSDLDLTFVYSGDGQAETTGGTHGKISHHEYFAKVAQGLLAMLQESGREGFLYRVDARLRPSGSKGTLVVSEAAFFDHHDRRAQLWERQALIKARGIAGDQSIFKRLEAQVLGPLVYDRALPPDAAVEIDRLRRRMESELGKETVEGLDTKVGTGGLVDVEFATQYLQLKFGRTTPAVRTSNTLAAIEALRNAGHLSEAAADTLRDGYLFHRRVENRLRLVHGYSLARLPTRGRALALFARRLRYLSAEGGAAFLQDYQQNAARVRQAYVQALGIA